MHNFELRQNKKFFFDFLLMKKAPRRTRAKNK